jgi:hypothetical protein
MNGRQIENVGKLYGFLDMLQKIAFIYFPSRKGYKVSKFGPSFSMILYLSLCTLEKYSEVLLL